MEYTAMSVSDFTRALSSRSAVPGGGGASALVGAVGASLGAMVGALTVGKPKYAAVDSEMRTLCAEADELRCRLLALVEADTQGFEPLSRAYGIPKSDPGRAAVLEDALRLACGAPMEMMRVCCRAVELLEYFAEKGSALVVSDAGVGAACCRAALEGASLNVLINTKSMADRDFAASLESEADGMLAQYVPRADDVYKAVCAKLGRRSDG